MRKVDILIDSLRELWDSFDEHPFVKGIAEGTLDKEIFMNCSRYEGAFRDMAWEMRR